MHDWNDWDADYELGYPYGQGLCDAKSGLAATLTRLRAAEHSMRADERVAYVTALDDIAKAHGIKATTVTTITYSAA